MKNKRKIVGLVSFGLFVSLLAHSTISKHKKDRIYSLSDCRAFSKTIDYSISPKDIPFSGKIITPIQMQENNSDKMIFLCSSNDYFGNSNVKINIPNKVNEKPDWYFIGIFDPNADKGNNWTVITFPAGYDPKTIEQEITSPKAIFSWTDQGKLEISFLGNIYNSQGYYSKVIYFYNGSEFNTIAFPLSPTKETAVVKNIMQQTCFVVANTDGSVSWFDGKNYYPDVGVYEAGTLKKGTPSFLSADFNSESFTTTPRMLLTFDFGNMYYYPGGYNDIKEKWIDLKLNTILSNNEKVKQVLVNWKVLSQPGNSIQSNYNYPQVVIATDAGKVYFFDGILSDAWTTIYGNELSNGWKYLSAKWYSNGSVPSIYAYSNDDKNIFFYDGKTSQYVTESNILASSEISTIWNDIGSYPQCLFINTDETEVSKVLTYYWNDISKTLDLPVNSDIKATSFSVSTMNTQLKTSQDSDILPSNIITSGSDTIGRISITNGNGTIWNSEYTFAFDILDSAFANSAIYGNQGLVILKNLDVYYNSGLSGWIKIITLPDYFKEPSVISNFKVSGFWPSLFLLKMANGNIQPSIIVSAKINGYECIFYYKPDTSEWITITNDHGVFDYYSYYTSQNNINDLRIIALDFAGSIAYHYVANNGLQRIGQERIFEKEIATANAIWNNGYMYTVVGSNDSVSNFKYYSDNGTDPYKSLFIDIPTPSADKWASTVSAISSYIDGSNLDFIAGFEDGSIYFCNYDRISQTAKWQKLPKQQNRKITSLYVDWKDYHSGNNIPQIIAESDSKLLVLYNCDQTYQLLNLNDFSSNIKSIFTYFDALNIPGILVQLENGSIQILSN